VSIAEKKYCPTCGIAMKGDSETCDNCGFELHEKEYFDVGEQHKVQEKSVSHEGIPIGDIADSRPSFREKPKHPAKSTKILRKSATKKNTPVLPNRSGTIVLQIKHLVWLTIGLVLILVSTILYYETRNATVKGESAQAVPPQGIDLAKLDKLKAQVESNPNDLETMLKYANALHDSKLPDQAIAYYQKFLSVHPDNADARVDMGVCYFELKDYATAIKEIEAVVTTNPDHQIGTFNLGIVNLNAGNKAVALEWFQKAIKLNPDSKMAETARQILNENQ